MTIVAAVDGSALGNPGPAGWAWVIDQETWAAGGWPSATNNQGELTALLRLLIDTANAGLARQPLRVLADSQYVINSVTKWMPGWKRNGWRTASKAPVKNQELMMALDSALAGRDVKFEWVKGHAGHSLNELADDRARGAAEAFRAGRGPDTGPGFGIDAGIGGNSAASVGAGGLGDGAMGNQRAATIAVGADSAAGGDEPAQPKTRRLARPEYQEQALF